MDKLCKYLDRELEEYENKVANGGKLSRTEIEDGKNLAKFKMALLTNEAMENDNYSNEYMDDMRQSNRGSSYARKRDNMGRYSRDDEFMSKLHELRDEAPDEHKRRKVERLINEMR